MTETPDSLTAQRHSLQQQLQDIEAQISDLSSRGRRKRSPSVTAGDRAPPVELRLLETQRAEIQRQLEQLNRQAGDARESPPRPKAESAGRKRAVPPQPGGSGHPDSAGVDAPRSGVEQADVASPGGDPAGAGPLAEAAAGGWFLRLSDLLALTVTDGGPALSASVADALQRAAAAPGPRSQEDFRVLRLADYLLASLAVGRGFPDGKEAPVSAHDFLLEWLDRRSSAELAERIPGWTLEALAEAPDEAAAGAVIHPELVSGLARGADIAARTHKAQTRVDARHLLAAVLTDPEGRAAFARAGLLEGAPEIFFGELAAALAEHVLSRPGDSELAEAWKQVLDPDHDWSLPPGTLPRPVTVYNPRYAPDTASKSSRADPLDIQAEVRAFSELIRLRDLQPPLSIGLFGDWGSGKSYFMERLFEAVRDLPESEAADSPFVGHVVQIKFNAWHYADANLWASLTAEFFDQLRVGGFEGKEPAAFGRLVGRVARQVGDAEREADSLADQVDALGREIDANQAELDRLEESQRNPTALLAETVAGRLDELLADHGVELGAAARALGLDEQISRDPDALRREARRLTALPGQLRLLRDAAAAGLAGRDHTLSALLYVTLALAGGALVLSMLGGPALAAVLASAGGLAASLWRTARLISPLVSAGARYLDDLESARRQAAEASRAARQQLAELQGRQQELQAVRAGREGFVSRYQAAAEGDSPARLLHYFLHESPEGRQFEEQVGLVSRVRRAFEALDSLIERQADRPAGAGDEAESLPPVDRIVLYIDDLDRCRDRQVVQVLEAIHLLLAFKSIVVVVGVDSRWLERSLAHCYQGQLAPGQAPASTEAGIDAPAATVQDYLEKIFQIPFWLSRLDPASTGSYGRLVDALVGDEVIAAGQPAATGGGDPQPERPGTRPAPGTTGEQCLPPVRVTLPEPAEPEAAETQRQRLLLDQREVRLMKALGALAGRSPRAVKRFVNLYRLLRAQQDASQLDAFLAGRESNPPPFAAMQFLLAAQVGLREGELLSLRGALAELPGSLTLGSLAAGDLKPGRKEITEETVLRLRQALPLEVRPRVQSALEALAQEAGDEATVEFIQDQLASTGRYGFARPVWR